MLITKAAIPIWNQGTGGIRGVVSDAMGCTEGTGSDERDSAGVIAGSDGTLSLMGCGLTGLAGALISGVVLGVALAAFSGTASDEAASRIGSFEIGIVSGTTGTISGGVGFTSVGLLAGLFSGSRRKSFNSGGVLATPSWAYWGVAQISAQSGKSERIA
jgi:hypothetical protein